MSIQKNHWVVNSLQECNTPPMYRFKISEKRFKIPLIILKKQDFKIFENEKKKLSCLFVYIFILMQNQQ